MSKPSGGNAPKTNSDLVHQIRLLELALQFEKRKNQKLTEENQKLQARVKNLVTKDDDRRIKLLVADGIRKKLLQLKTLTSRGIENLHRFANSLDEFCHDIEDEVGKTNNDGAIEPVPTIDVKPDLMLPKFEPELSRIAESPIMPKNSLTPEDNVTEVNRSRSNRQNSTGTPVSAEIKPRYSTHQQSRETPASPAKVRRSRSSTRQKSMGTLASPVEIQKSRSSVTPDMTFMQTPATRTSSRRRRALTTDELDRISPTLDETDDAYVDQESLVEDVNEMEKSNGLGEVDESTLHAAKNESIIDDDSESTLIMERSSIDQSDSSMLNDANHDAEITKDVEKPTRDESVTPTPTIEMLIRDESVTPTPTDEQPKTQEPSSSNTLTNEDERRNSFYYVDFNQDKQTSINLNPGKRSSTMSTRSRSTASRRGKTSTASTAYDLSTDSEASTSRTMSRASETADETLSRSKSSLLDVPSVQRNRPKRAAKEKIATLKEPHLNKKMRRE